MTRSEKREQGFILIFESLFGDQTVHNVLENTHRVLDEELSDYSRELLWGVEDNKAMLNSLIDNNTKNWARERISKASLAILYLALFEMKFNDKVPQSVAINEAVNLAKKYGAEQDPKFINGILGAIARQGDDDDQ